MPTLMTFSPQFDPKISRNYVNFISVVALSSAVIALAKVCCTWHAVGAASFLIKEAGVTVRVRDDYGHTPMHDVCWTCEPNFELFELNMTACPDLIFMSDRRGNTPLEYARREHWGAYSSS
jgi:hypothetical protein